MHNRVWIIETVSRPNNRMVLKLFSLHLEKFAGIATHQQQEFHETYVIIKLLFIDEAT